MRTDVHIYGKGLLLGLTYAAFFVVDLAVSTSRPGAFVAGVGMACAIILLVVSVKIERSPKSDRDDSR